MVDAANALVTQAQIDFKNIYGLDDFVNKEQWSVIQMKEEYHIRFVAIMKIVYQQKRLTYFSTCIGTTFNLTNKGKKANQ